MAKSAASFVIVIVVATLLGFDSNFAPPTSPGFSRAGSIPMPGEFKN
jgi:hypothetical protein